MDELTFIQTSMAKSPFNYISGNYECKPSYKLN